MKSHLQDMTLQLKMPCPCTFIPFGSSGFRKNLLILNSSVQTTSSLILGAKYLSLRLECITPGGFLQRRFSRLTPINSKGKKSGFCSCFVNKKIDRKECFGM